MPKRLLRIQSFLTSHAAVNDDHGAFAVLLLQLFDQVALGLSVFREDQYFFLRPPRALRPDEVDQLLV